MDILNKSVLDFFYQISSIPRQSGNEKAIALYLVEFAKKRNLKYDIDKNYNVIIYKKNCEKEPLILQAHTDMVCVKDKNFDFNFDKDGIKIKRTLKYLSAVGTTLGADNGIGAAMILAILDSDLPVNIEAVFTSQEETTMLGAETVDITKLNSKKMICLDGFCENKITISTAGFMDYLVGFNTAKKTLKKEMNCFEIALSGLPGGHSGFDIDKNIKSSHKVMCTFLKLLGEIKLVKINGGKNFNVIPSSTKVEILSTLTCEEMQFLSKKFAKENKIKIAVNFLGKKQEYLKYGKDILGFINNFKQGVIKKDKNNFVVLSRCLSEINDGEMKIGVRCADNNDFDKMEKTLNKLSEKYNLEGRKLSCQKAFNSFDNSELVRDLLKANKKAKIEKCHFATENGIIQDRKKDLDIVIISPKIENAHSTRERVKIKTIFQTMNWLKRFLIN